LQEVLKRIPESKQTLLFSATLPKLLVEFAKAGLTHPLLGMRFPASDCIN
jgi:ATP-dependent RNA helicase DDX54/DBP10